MLRAFTQPSILLLEKDVLAGRSGYEELLAIL